MDAVAAMLHQLDPRPWLIISCNHGGYDLSVPNVYYARDGVWDRPMDWPVGAGRIEQFYLQGQPVGPNGSVRPKAK
jgi:hypothetical protein